MKKILCFLFLLPAVLCAELAVPNIFSDHMVLQQEQTIRVWGTGSAGNSVTVEFAGASASAKIGPDETWEVDLPAMAGSFTPQTLMISDGRETLRFNDVLVGEVWLCSGQSNMAWTVNRVKDADLESLMATHPSIRLYKVNRVTSLKPRFSDDATWQKATPSTVGNFSAVGYYFGRDLRKALDVPVGLIDASWGGTPAIAWTRQDVLSKHPLLMEEAANWEGYVDTYDDRLADWEEELKVWLEDKNLTLYVEDPGITQEASTWNRAVLNDFRWEKVELPATIEQTHGEMDGAVWYRRRVELPAVMRGKDVSLSLGTIADFDKTWVNGVLVGETGPGEERPHMVERRYTIPARLTRTGELSIAIRVFDRVAEGGFTGDSRSMVVIGESSVVRLAGAGWVTRVESRLESAVGDWQLRQYPDAPKRPPAPDSPHRPASLANGMLAPVAPYTLRGAIWYQGEADAGWEPQTYDERLKVMIDDWRDWWETPSLHVGVVQLANFLEPKDMPSDDPWPHLREAQRDLVETLPYSGLAVTIDIGEAKDIHPRNKQEVGRRLSRWALTDVYDRLELRGGPVPAQVSFDEGRVVIRFDQTGSGLTFWNGSALQGFTLAGQDGVFHPADAKIEGKSRVVVSSDNVLMPVHVRYAWQNNPVEANLGNQERLPATPFELMAE
jgi:sialate O-acetylesterase